MSNKLDFSFVYICFVAATAGVFIAIVGHPSDLSALSSTFAQLVSRSGDSTHLRRLELSVRSYNEQPYSAQIFSRDPLIIYIKSFLSKDEISRLLHLSEGRYEQSKIYRIHDKRVSDLNMRVSESSHVEREDEVVRRIEKRALDFQGWRGDDTVMEHPTIQRYEVDVFYNYHYDWDPTMTKANRVTTFNIYLAGDYTRGGTNSPYLSPPKDTRWCDVIECDEAGKDGYQGVVVKPIARSAIYWENLQFTQTVPHIKECAMLAF